MDPPDASLPSSSLDKTAVLKMLVTTPLPLAKVDSTASLSDLLGRLKPFGSEDPEAAEGLWRLCTKAKGALPSGERLENLSWRLLHMSLKKKNDTIHEPPLPDIVKISITDEEPKNQIFQKMPIPTKQNPKKSQLSFANHAKSAPSDSLIPTQQNLQQQLPTYDMDLDKQFDMLFNSTTTPSTAPIPVFSTDLFDFNTSFLNHNPIMYSNTAP
ncbi:hypothetical protein HDU98_005106, partial [Podochytrium sp. JEL0797]